MLSAVSILVFSSFLLLGLPLTSLAAFEFFPVIKAVNLQFTVQVDGKPVKSPVTVATDKEFTLVWKSVGKGCISNWEEESLEPSGSASDSITKSRAFFITCFGRGAAQTATVQVNVGTADLVVGTFSAVGLKPARGKKGVYLTDPDSEEAKAPFTLKATLKNQGKLPVSTPFKVKYVESEDLDEFISVGERMIAGIGSGATLPVEELPRLGNPNGDKRYYKVCVDTEEEVDESKEDNNCSKVLGPFTFIESSTN